jgi:diguanylate cyclase (GGDEF)-like protein/PAS domain S-box-containing protein
VLDLVAGREVSCTDGNAAPLDPPGWLFDSGATAPTATAGQWIALTHPDDLQLQVDAWLQVTRSPGAVIEIETRVKLGGDWVPANSRKINLLGEPGLGCILDAVAFDRSIPAAELDEVMEAAAVEETRYFIHTLDESGIVIATEGMVQELTGRSAAEIIGTNAVEQLHPDAYDDALRVWLDIQNGPVNTTRSGRWRLQRPDGSTVWVENTLIKRVDEHGRPVVTSIAHDASHRLKQEAALKHSQQEFRLLADQVPAAVFRTDADQRITFRNQRWQDDLDGSAPVERLADIVHPDDRAAHTEELRRLAAGRSDTTAAYEIRSAEGGRVFAITCRSVVDVINGTRSYIGSITDITATVRLREQAQRDGLTGLINRRATEERLDAALALDAEHAVVVFVDLDGFKAVNDTWGHDAGDRVLRTVADRLNAAMRPGDIVGRFGGDEFLLVVTGLDEEADAGLVARIEGALVEPITWPGGSWSPAASIGIAHGVPGEGAASLITRADHEMFADKRQRKAVG